ncbi:MAG: hypothetical protein Q4F72_04250 [Desulfovibrionaceae bacterium]|nr:hypothetical protein [Desulfovibrionaceae bacterium]
MKRPGPAVSVIPLVYLSIWLVCAALVFAGSMHDNWFWLSARSIPVRDVVPARTAVPAAKPEPAAPQVQEATPVPVRSMRPEITNPRFETTQQGLSASFDLGVVPSGPPTLQWQASPAAWAVNVPGSWKVKGNAELDIPHPAFRSVLILNNGKRAKFRFYYRDPRHSQGTEPEVRLTDRGITISIPADQTTSRPAPAAEAPAQQTR